MKHDAYGHLGENGAEPIDRGFFSRKTVFRATRGSVRFLAYVLGRALPDRVRGSKFVDKVTELAPDMYTAPQEAIDNHFDYIYRPLDSGRKPTSPEVGLRLIAEDVGALSKRTVSSVVKAASKAVELPSRIRTRISPDKRGNSEAGLEENAKLLSDFNYRVNEGRIGGQFSSRTLTDEPRETTKNPNFGLTFGLTIEQPSAARTNIGTTRVYAPSRSIRGDDSNER